MLSASRRQTCKTSVHHLDKYDYTSRTLTKLFSGSQVDLRHFNWARRRALASAIVWIQFERTLIRANGFVFALNFNNASPTPSKPKIPASCFFSPAPAPLKRAYRK